ncbi:hypothetical protein ABPG73_021599 [Tetrahymena malaccensis]
MIHKQIQYFFYFLIIFEANLQLTIASNSVSYVYSPQYLNSLSSSDKKWTPLQINVAGKSGLVFITSGFYGITITDQLGSKILLTQNVKSLFIKQIQISQDGQFIFIRSEATLMLFQLQYQYQFDQFKVLDFTQKQLVEFSESIFNLFYIEDDELLIVALYGGLIKAFDTTNKQNLFQIGEINLQIEQFDGFFLSKNKNWLYIAANTEGMFIINLQDTNKTNTQANTRQLNFLNAGYGVYGYQSTFCVATSDGFVYGIDIWYGIYFANSTIVFQASEQQYPIQITFTNYWPFKNMIPTLQSLTINQEETYIFLGAYSQGIYIFDIRQRANIKIFQLIKADSLAYSIALSYDEQYLYLSNASNVLTFSKYLNNITKVSEMITFSLDSTFAVQTFQTGLILYNSTDIFNMQIYCFYENIELLQGQNQGACITRDNKWILSTIREFGVYLLNVENKTNPILVNYLITQGGENVLISNISNYAYLIDGFQGFAIIDTNYFPKINIISRVYLGAYVVMGIPIMGEDYILVTQENNFLITLIDIRNKQFPQIVNKISFQSQSGQAVCMPKAQDHLFITSQLGIITIPTSSDVQIHTEVNLIIQNQQISTIQVKKLQKTSYYDLQNGFYINDEYIFQVSQNIQLNFNIIYPLAQTMQISKIYFYQDGQMLDLPSYFQFNLFGQSIQMNIDKQLLGADKSEINMNFILLWTVIPLNSTSFTFYSQGQGDEAITNQNQSSLIYQYLQDQYILDSNNFVESTYDFTKGVFLDQDFQEQLVDPKNYSQQQYQIVIQQIIQKINLTLQKSCYINPIKFYVKSSLSFDNKSPQQFISTVQIEKITVTLQVNISDGKIVSVSSSSITTYMSVNQDQLKIEGSLDNVNAFLQSKIIFSNNTEISSSKSPYITITVEDNVNYPLIQQYKISEIEDIEILDYKYFYLDINETYISIPLNLWLQQQGEILSFKGQTTQSMYGLTYRFKIVASDGYTIAEDCFYVKSGIIQIKSDFQQIPNTSKQFIRLIKSYNVSINLYLLREVIFADVLGFTANNPSKITPSVGLSIHLNSNKISQVAAFKKKKASKWLGRCLKILNIEYTEYSLSKNRRLPSWMSFNLKHDKIILSGTPQNYNEECILIKIVDINGYSIYQYKLELKQNTQFDDKKSLINKTEQTNLQLGDKEQQDQSLIIF